MVAERRRREFLFRLFVVSIVIGLFFSWALPGNSAAPPSVTPSGNADDLSRADALCAEKSFRLAREIYDAFVANPANAKHARLREVRFKAADCLWREGDGSKYEDARKELERLKIDDDKDRWHAEASQSLAELYLQWNRWQPERQKDIERNFLQAIAWWRASPDVALGLPKFVQLNFLLGDYLSQTFGWQPYEGQFSLKAAAPYVIELPRPIPPGESHYERGLARKCYRDIVEKSPAAADKAKALFLLAQYAARMESWDSNANSTEADKKARLEDEKGAERVIQEFPKTEWLDDALMHSAQRLEQKNDFVGAVKQLRRLTAEFRKDQTPLFEQATQKIAEITEPQVSLHNNQAFPPGSYIQVNFSYRNIQTAGLTLWKIDPFSLVQGREEQGIQEAVKRLALASSGKQSRQWTEKPKAIEKEHQSGSHPVYLDPLEPGMYVVEAISTPAARMPRSQTRALILVTDLAVTMKAGRNEVVVFAANAMTGEPAPGTALKIVHRWSELNFLTKNWSERRETLEGTTGEDGMAKIAIPNADAPPDKVSSHRFSTVADFKGMPAFAGEVSQHFGARQSHPVIYAYSDRPAYRPKETIHFKAILRENDGWNYALPQRKEVVVRISDPQGSQLYERTLALSEYGTVSGEVELKEEPALGMYSIAFLEPVSLRGIGGAPLCRVEEYKLPEFKVSIASKEKTYRLGDTMNVDIAADYYFGGPVSNAEVAVVVKQRPYHHWHWWPRPYPWFYADSMRGGGRFWPGWGGGSETTVKEETLKTDAQGKATLNIETKKDSGTDLEYTIEARVVDQSRREIRSTKNLRVTRKEYFAYLQPQHCIYRPGDKARIGIKTQNANEEPVARNAQIKIYRLTWSDEEVVLQGIKRKKGYVRSEMFSQPIESDKEGAAEFEFQPNEPAHLEIEWAGKDKYGEDVTGSTRIYVCRPEDRDIGYRYGGLQIVLDRETYQKGDTARLLLISFMPHSFALLTLEAEDIYYTKVVEMDGPVQMVEIPIGAEHEPNVYAQAAMFHGRRAFLDQREIVVPPAENYVEVRVKPDKERYQPGEKGAVEVETVDWKGQPVTAEVSLGLVDSAVYYIQNELADDIRKFFYGQKRGLQISTSTSFDPFPFQRLVKNDKGEIVPADPSESDALNELAQMNQEEFERDNKDGRERSAGQFHVLAGRKPIGMERGAMAVDGMAMPAEAPVFKSVPDVIVGDSEDNIGVGSAPLAEAVVRTDFRSTVFWQPDIVTDAQGKARVEVAYPDSITEWKATARSIDRQTRVGVGDAETHTKKNIMVRLQAPRFFVEGDEAVISGIVHNYTDEDRVVVATLEATGLEFVAVSEGAAVEAKEVSTEPVLASGAKIEIGVPKDGERRVDWRLKASKKGEAKIKAVAQTTVESDAMEKTYPILEHGIEKFVAEAGKLGGGPEAPGAETSVEFTLSLPEARNPGADSFVIHLQPSLAATMVDALEYLADYPYGCVEQTLSRFVPTVITARTLKQLGISRPDLDKKLPDMIKAGLDRLRDFQHGDGGWAWWKQGDSDPFMTAYVLYGLTLAKDAGTNVPQSMLDGAIRCLNDNVIKFENEPDMLAWCLHALSYHKPLGETANKMLEKVWARRDKLNAYTRALLLIACHNLGDTEKSAILAQNMENAVVLDKDGGTAHWGTAGVSYRWSEGGIEATAYAMKALLAADPRNARIDQAMLWLTKNRRGARWKNTRDTAIVIYALADYIRVRQESKPDYEATVFVNGEKVASAVVDPDNIFDFKGEIQVPARLLKSGENKVRIVKKGSGSLYWAGWLTYYTKEDPIAAAGNEIFIQREYYRLTDKPTVGGEYTTEREKLTPGMEIRSGDRIEVVLNIDARNHYEYLVFEDLKAAGLEAVDLQSGYEWRDGLSIYREFRDEKTALFVTQMQQGKHKLTYTLRAEVPGHFSALPALGHAMYVPEIRANSDEFKFGIGEAAKK